MPSFNGKWRLAFFVFVCAAALGGCGPMAMSGVPFLGQADALTVVSTDKTIVDHFVSISSGEELLNNSPRAGTPLLRRR